MIDNRNNDGDDDGEDNYILIVIKTKHGHGRNSFYLPSLSLWPGFTCKQC